MILSENEEWHGVFSSGRGFNFQPKQTQVTTDHIDIILMRNSSSDDIDNGKIMITITVMILNDNK